MDELTLGHGDDDFDLTFAQHLESLIRKSQAPVARLKKERRKVVGTESVVLHSGTEKFHCDHLQEFEVIAYKMRCKLHDNVLYDACVRFPDGYFQNCSISVYEDDFDRSAKSVAVHSAFVQTNLKIMLFVSSEARQSLSEFDPNVFGKGDRDQ